MTPNLWLREVSASVGAYPESRLSLLKELGLTAPQACVACDAGFATLEVALGSASPCPCAAVRGVLIWFDLR